MRREDLEPLNEPYSEPRTLERDRRFDNSIGADIPSASRLAAEIFDDLNTTSFGISWWGSLPDQERILISDYLYQCADSIETNLAEARLHYLEWLDAQQKENRRLADIVSRDEYGRVGPKFPRSNAPIDDLYKKLEELHIAGFFRAIGSSLDCLGGAIVGVLALPTSLRRSDLDTAKRSLNKITASSAGTQIQVDFRDFLEDVKQGVGPEDWLYWATQYRNMYVHRGRRSIRNQIVDTGLELYDAQEQLIPRFTTTLHLPKHPDKSENEAMVLNSEIILSEDAEVTMQGIFISCRDLEEAVCERLVDIWYERRGNPHLLAQPVAQWTDVGRASAFDGYNHSAKTITGDTYMSHPILLRRMLAGSLDDAHKKLWAGSKWDQ